MNFYELRTFALEVQTAFKQLRERVQTLEHQAAALSPLLDTDRLEVARVCQQAGVMLKDLEGRAASEARARAANRVFTALRQRGWSLDRIAKATGYSTRGVASNLERFQT